MLLPGAGCLEEWAALLTHRGDDLAERVGDGLSLQLVEQRLRVEEVDVRWAAFHEEEDDGFRFRDAAFRSGDGPEGVGEAGERDRPEPGSGTE